MLLMHFFQDLGKLTTIANYCNYRHWVYKFKITSNNIQELQNRSDVAYCADVTKCYFVFLQNCFVTSSLSTITLFSLAELLVVAMIHTKQPLINKPISVEALNGHALIHFPEITR